MGSGTFGLKLGSANREVIDGGGAADFRDEFVAHIRKLVFELFKPGIDSVEPLLDVGAKLLLLLLQSINPGAQPRRYEVLQSRPNIFHNAHRRYRPVVMTITKAARAQNGISSGALLVGGCRVPYASGDLQTDLSTVLRVKRGLEVEIGS